VSIPDPYRVLQVDSSAGREVIEASYRRLARKYHPDVSTEPGTVEKMVQINHAWELLRDSVSRAAVDRARTRSAGTSAQFVAAHGRANASRGAGSPADAAPGPDARTIGVGSAGAPPGNPSGSIITFGRYVGWTLGEIARANLDYLEWLDRMPIGHSYQAEIDALLRRYGRRVSDPGPEHRSRGRFRRR
jgi:curved DNA-binding protein CbpA